MTPSAVLHMAPNRKDKDELASFLSIHGMPIAVAVLRSATVANVGAGVAAA